jgi:hypothetical protein
MGEMGGENFAMPDLSNLDLSNIDLSQFNLPAQPAAVAPAPQAAAPFSPSQQIGSNALEPRDGPTGIETMAAFVGQGDFLGIPLPDGSNLGATPAIEPSPPSYYEDTPNNNGLTPAQQAGLDAFNAQYPNGFDLNLGNIGSEGGFGGNSFNNPLFSDPGLGGGPLPDTKDGGDFQPQIGTMGGPVYDDAGNLIGNLGSAGPLFGEPGGGAIGNDFDQQYGEDFGSLIGFGPVGVEGGWSYDGNGNEINGGPAGGEEPAVDNTPNNNGLTPAQQAALDAYNESRRNEGGTVGNHLDVGNVGSEGGYGNSTGYSDFHPEYDPETGLNAAGMTREQQAALNAYLANNPTGYTGNYNPVIPVGPVANLGGGDPDPDTGTYAPRVAAPVNVRAASNYALTGAVPVTPVNAGNPFVRPETQQGIGSLGGGG